ncbi:unnamed protein product [Protopolystoma xenopodis]|uniref:Uncharacterized protein n=1 Tax=Protopolystoma xenopodis TaxID=117903 RepID=A0A3S5A4J5_9PLAT|nr:unnamed protein product [Protopolystoma xenopodis]
MISKSCNVCLCVHHTCRINAPQDEETLDTFEEKLVRIAHFKYGLHNNDVITSETLPSVYFLSILAKILPWQFWREYASPISSKSAVTSRKNKNFHRLFMFLPGTNNNGLTSDLNDGTQDDRAKRHAEMRLTWRESESSTSRKSASLSKYSTTEPRPRQPRTTRAEPPVSALPALKTATMQDCVIARRLYRKNVSLEEETFNEEIISESGLSRHSRKPPFSPHQHQKSPMAWSDRPATTAHAVANGTDAPTPKKRTRSISADSVLHRSQSPQSQPVSTAQPKPRSHHRLPADFEPTSATRLHLSRSTAHRLSGVTSGQCLSEDGDLNANTFSIKLSKAVICMPNTFEVPQMLSDHPLNGQGEDEYTIDANFSAVSSHSAYRAGDTDDDCTHCNLTFSAFRMSGVDSNQNSTGPSVADSHQSASSDLLDSVTSNASNTGTDSPPFIATIRPRRQQAELLPPVKPRSSSHTLKPDELSFPLDSCQSIEPGRQPDTLEDPLIQDARTSHFCMKLPIRDTTSDPGRFREHQNGNLLKCSCPSLDNPEIEITLTSDHADCELLADKQLNPLASSSFSDPFITQTILNGHASLQLPCISHDLIDSPPLPSHSDVSKESDAHLLNNSEQFLATKCFSDSHVPHSTEFCASRDHLKPGE